MQTLPLAQPDPRAICRHVQHHQSFRLCRSAQQVRQRARLAERSTKACGASVYFKGASRASLPESETLRAALKRERTDLWAQERIDRLERSSVPRAPLLVLLLNAAVKETLAGTRARLRVS